MDNINQPLENIDDLIADLAAKSTHKVLAIWAADCAEHVLPFFEDKFPTDARPREAIEAGRAWVRIEIKTGEARKVAFTAHAAARDAIDDPCASAAARCAGQACATAHTKGHAVHCASYGVKSALNSVPASQAKVTADAERKWQYTRLLELNA